MKKTKIITGGIIGLAFLLNAGISLAADNCSVSTSCASLGYITEASNCQRGVHCPFDSSKVACIHEEIAIGDYLLSDGTFSKDPELDSGNGWTTSCWGGWCDIIAGVVIETTGGGFPVTVYTSRYPASATASWSTANDECLQSQDGYMRSTLIDPPSTSYYDTINASLTRIGASQKFSTSHTYFTAKYSSGNKVGLCGVVIFR
ncbi:MAG: hypothetical protein R3Y43_05795 [Alphaproteobacteria bacterium]